MTSIFAQREARLDAAPIRPIGILADVDLIAYTADARVLGRFPNAAARRGLDDPARLRELTQLEIVHAATWPLADDRPTPCDDLTLLAAEVDAFEVVERSVTGLLGRRDPLQRPLAIAIGPYRVEGTVRVQPGGDPVAAFARSAGLVLLRDAWIDYPVAQVRRRRLAARLVVNRDVADWFGPAADG